MGFPVFIHQPFLNLSQTTTFRLFQTDKTLQTILSLMNMTEKSPNGQKTLGEKEKLLVTSNLSFSHSVFKRLYSRHIKKKGSCGRVLRTFFPWFSKSSLFRSI